MPTASAWEVARRSAIARALIEDEIERLIGLLDAIDPDPDLEPSLGGNGYLMNSVEATDLEGDTADDEPSLGAPNVQLPVPLYHLVGGGHGHCLFPMHREGGELHYSAAGFSQLAWGEGLSRDDLEDEHDGAEPCCEDEGAQSDDEGFQCAR